MKKKFVYLLLLACGMSPLSFARQRCSDTFIVEPAKGQHAAEADVAAAKKGYDLSPVGFFVLNM
ncbi:hypothetical protein LZZ85_22845 [Terrimonas sp. NA20]|uniref:Uncharacterized protein n=1 Tax=Terrimonas ginsenosidimutans TaxID=2908004 RepID=A0ABS9KXQ2_9BACT|nr:hypothetical protein [Terrimonas ginsenosidimutans]MCG2617152.1 hypothetical protein [Terrimonas ginsenosidimutans]